MVVADSVEYARALEWVGEIDGHIAMIDQTLLPGKFTVMQIEDVETVFDAIRRLAVRGAPAIGVAAGMGVVLGIRDFSGDDRDGFVQRVEEVCNYLAGSRPTAVNLFWALDRMKRVATDSAEMSVAEMKKRLLTEAIAIHREDQAMCRAMGEVGTDVIPDGGAVLTHCNAGALATGGMGTALSVMYRAHELGRRFRVYADETRPLLQGARLTTWELMRAGIDTTLICDNAAAQVLKEGRIDVVITGADRIAANGDAANKIGTYGVALLAAAHDVPFYVAAPSSTFDMTLASGDEIPIEQRSADEVRRGFGVLTSPEDVQCYCPAFDVTPARLVTGLITERGVAAASAEGLAGLYPELAHDN